MKLLGSKNQAVTKRGDTLPKSWPKNHADAERIIPIATGFHVILPLIPKPVYILYILDIQYHNTQITKKPIAFLNHIQTSKDVCDKPVDVLTTETPIQKPEFFRSDKVFSSRDGLPLEHCLLSLNGN